MIQDPQLIAESVRCDCICHLDKAPPHPDGRRCPHCGRIEAIFGDPDHNDGEES